jgi:hypothetical protein
MKYVAVIICFACFCATVGMAQPVTGDGPVILQPKNGEIVKSPVTIRVGGGGEGSAMPGMSGGERGAHLHLIIDAPLPAVGKMVPMDAHHIHLMHGETQKTIPLKPGPHTIQLIEGSMSHVVGAAAPHSDPVTFEVR